ncbi:unnamed protein product, partial [Rotaria sordida]
QNPIPLYNGPVTRSRTGKLPSSSIKLYKDDIDELLKLTIVKLKNEQLPVPKSAISKHYIKTHHMFTKDDFSTITPGRVKNIKNIIIFIIDVIQHRTAPL